MDESVWRRREDQFDNSAVLERNRSGGGSIMVRGRITTRHRTALYHAEGTLTGDCFKGGILRFCSPSLFQPFSRLVAVQSFKTAKSGFLTQGKPFCSKPESTECSGQPTVSTWTRFSICETSSDFEFSQIKSPSTFPAAMAPRPRQGCDTVLLVFLCNLVHM